METLNIELQPVTNSSNVAGYARNGNELVIQFLGKGERDSDGERATRRAYRYTAIGEDDRNAFDAFESAESKGKAFIQAIKPVMTGAQVQIAKRKD